MWEINPITKALLDKLSTRKLNQYFVSILDDMNDYDLGMSDYTKVLEFMTYCDKRNLRLHKESHHWGNVHEDDKANITQLWEIYEENKRNKALLR